MANSKEITLEEKQLIQDAVDNALSFGTGILTACKEALEDFDYKWGEHHEKYVFETYVDK